MNLCMRNEWIVWNKMFIIKISLTYSYSASSTFLQEGEVYQEYWINIFDPNNQLKVDASNIIVKEKTDAQLSHLFFYFKDFIFEFLINKNLFCSYILNSISIRVVNLVGQQNS